MPKNIILVDKRVQGYETIVAAIDLDICIPILFDYYTDTIEDIKGRITGCVANDTLPPSPRCVGLLQHNYNRPFYNLVAADTESSIILGVETHDPDLATWAPLRDLIAWCATTPEVGGEYFDMMACALYSNPDWKYIIDTLTTQVGRGVTIRASTDNTGSATQGGNWFLESHTGVNLKGVYFTDAIEEYQGVLYSETYDLIEYSTKGFASGEVVTWGEGPAGGGGTGGISSNVIGICSNNAAYAALKSDGSVVTWGNAGYGGNSSSVASSISSGILQIYTTASSFAALKTNGSVITWGDQYSGGNSSSVSASISSGVVTVYFNQTAFAALKNNGALITWGNSTYGGNSSSVSSSLTSGVIAVYSTILAFAALKLDGSVITWGESTYGGDSSAVSSSISSGVVAVYSTESALAALKSDGSVITWGDSVSGGDSSSVSASISSGVVAIFSNLSAFAALKSNGSVITWGYGIFGGNSTSVSASISSNVVTIYSTQYAFAALKTNGSLITWGYTDDGGNSNAVGASLASGVVAVYSTRSAFAALKSNGSVITWGNSGGDSSAVASSLTSGVVAVYSNTFAFAALKNNGTVITWGYAPYGGNSSGTSFGTTISIYSNGTSFAALKTTATTFDLSMSYYTDMDRFNILRKKENRRRVNLASLNNNVFTISQPSDIQSFNPTMSTDKTLRIIVPDYVASSYSIASTATIPSSSGNYIVACDQGEPVTISGVTYVNYGIYVYKQETNNTYTKLTSATINGNLYATYGGINLYSSGIAFVTLYPPPTLSNFADITKVSNAAPFQLTPPTSNSTGAFSYTSSNASVATIAGTTVTLTGFGTSTITATQASDNANYGSGSITATLTTTSANYYGADLSGTDFTNISLYGATLNLANLTNVIFVTTNLTNATLNGATLANILSRGIIGLSTAASTLPTGYTGRGGSIFGNNVRITGANLTNVDLSNVVLTNSDVSGAIFTGATLTNIRTAGLTGTATATLPTGYVFCNSIIVGPNVSLAAAALSSADLSGISIAGTDLSGATLTGTNLTNVVSGSLRNASLTATPPDHPPQ